MRNKEIKNRPLGGAVFLTLFFERLYNWIQITVHYLFYVVPFFVDAMVGDAIIGEVVGADFFGAISRTDLLLAECADRLGFLALHFLEQF